MSSERYVKEKAKDLAESILDHIYSSADNESIDRDYFFELVMDDIDEIRDIEFANAIAYKQYCGDEEDEEDELL